MASSILINFLVLLAILCAFHVSSSVIFTSICVWNLKWICDTKIVFQIFFLLFTLSLLSANWKVALIGNGLKSFYLHQFSHGRRYFTASISHVFNSWVLFLPCWNLKFSWDRISDLLALFIIFLLILAWFDRKFCDLSSFYQFSWSGCCVIALYLYYLSESLY